MTTKKTKDIQAIVNNRVAKELSRIIPNSVTYEGELVTCSNNPEKTVVLPGQSRPLSMKKWEDIFGADKRTLRTIYHFHQASPRKWTLSLSELPAEYLEKYKKTIPKSHS